MSQGFIHSGFNAKVAGDVVQVQRYETGASATGTTTIPDDDTIPQNTEGDQYMSVSITPTNANSTLKIDVVAMWGNSAGQNAGIALFQDSTANAIAAIRDRNDVSNGGVTSTLTHYMTAGTTSSTTFKVRIGGDSAGTTTFNGTQGNRLYGGVMASSITVTEIASGTLIREVGTNINGNAGVAKAWVAFDGTGTPATTYSHNVSSITDHGTGDYTINFTTPFASANYVMVATAGTASGTSGYTVLPFAKLAGSTRITIRQTDNQTLTDVDDINVTFFGTQ